MPLQVAYASCSKINSGKKLFILFFHESDVQKEPFPSIYHTQGKGRRHPFPCKGPWVKN